MGSLDVPESMCIQWTNEKHSLYLKSMEASFVDQLYNSKHLLGHPRRFKFLRGGYWEEANLERVTKLPKLDKSDEVCARLGDAWIDHFKSSDQCKYDNHRRRHHRKATPDRKTPITCTSSTQPNHNHGPKNTATFSRSRHFDQQHFPSANAEISDQNFVSEDSEGEEESIAGNAKRVRSTALVVTRNDASANDQVVPFGRVYGSRSY